MKHFALSCILLYALAAGSGDDGAPKSFTVGGTITGYAEGHAIHIAAYSSEKNFKKQVCHAKMRFKADELPAETLLYEFAAITRGYYLIAAFQDMNDDRTFNKGLFGRPLEPYCLYRPHTGLFAPSFSKCKFMVESNVSNAHLRF